MSIFASNDFEQAKVINEKIAGLEKKSKESGISYSILKQVYDRGMAAWKTGHRPGASQQQWAFARVNSFITKGSGTWGKADKDLASKVRSAKKEDVKEAVLGHDFGTNPFSKKEAEQAKKLAKQYSVRVKPHRNPKSKNHLEFHGGTRNLQAFYRNLQMIMNEEDVKEADSDYMKGVAKDKKDDRAAQFDKQAKMDDDDPNAYKPAPGDKDKDGEMKKTKLSKHTKAYHAKFGKKESVKSVFTGEVNHFAEAKIKFRNERDVEKHKQNLLMAMEIAVDADGDYTNAVKQIEKLERGLSKNPSVAAALKFYAEDVEFPQDIADELQEKNPGLWANIHAKRKRIKAGSGERMRKKGEKGAPKELPEEDVMKMIEGRYSKYSDLLMQRARIIGDVGKQAFMGKSQEIKKIDRLIAKELKKLGVEPDAAG
jgi:hypothetical protein